MEFRILGPLDVIDEERAVNLPGTKHRALLAMLLLHANEVVSTERLIDALWEGERPRAARKTLQVYVSQLRKVLGRDRVHTKPPGYLLRVDGDELDLTRFQRLVDAGRLKEALLLWRGPPLAEFAYERFAQGEIARLEELRLASLERRIAHELDAGRHAELVGELGVLVRDHPLREQLRAQLMLALYRSGRQAEALAAYREARRVLVDELGIEPGLFLRELEKAMLGQEPGLDLASTSHEERVTTSESRSAFVGREAELDELRAGLGAAVAGRGRLVLVSGEPGAGKSRLAEELTREAGTGGARILTGRCWEGGGAPAYWPWVQSLRAYVRESTPELLRAQLGTGAVELAQVLPELREMLPGLPEPASLDSDGARFRLLYATAEFLRNACADRPTVLVLDDLHAADPPSLVLLRFLARELGSIRLLVLGAYRDVDPVPGQRLSEMLVEVAREPGTRRLSLGGLSEREVTRYVEWTAPAIASPELGAALHEQTEGNPLFVAETVRLLSLEGIEPESAGRLRLAIPRNVREVIARRLSHLSEDCNRVLVLASVLGREFALDALARLGGLSVDDLLNLLDKALAARVVSDVPGAPGRLRFSHVLIRDTIHDGVGAARRARLHRRAAEALEDLYGDSLETPERVLALAQHWSQAGEPARAIALYRRGGELALRVFANYDAAEALTRGVDLLRQMPESARRDEQELELTVLLGAARGWGSPDYSRARDLSVKLGRAVSPPILRGMAMNSILRLELADAREDAIALLVTGERDDDPVLVVEGEYVLGVTSFWQGLFQESRRHLQAAIDRYSPARSETHMTVYSQDPKIVCLSRLAWTFWFLGYPELAAEARDSALSLADELNHPFSRGYASLYGAIVSQELHDEPARARLVEATETLATDERFELLRAWSSVLRHSSLARRGDSEALIAMSTAISSLEKSRRSLLNSYFVSLLARACLVVGEPRQGLEAVTTALVDTQRTGARYMESELQCLRGELLVALGAPAADIERAFGLAREIACRQDAKALELRATGELARWGQTRR
jgi:DNA-binding SARP family transcriptional activator/tetratricopeptide (TPR) repeat protein